MRHFCHYVTLFALVGLTSAAWSDPPAEKAEKPRVSAGASAAVQLSLNDYFSGTWNYGKVYIQSTPHVPPGLDRVGKYEAEVISEEDLKKRFEGKEKAPAFARLSVSTTEEKDEIRCEVFISYTGLPTKGAKEIPLGGGKLYKFKVQGSKAELIETSTVRY